MKNRYLSLTLVCLLALGCFGDSTGTLKGTVSFDGVPLEYGSITFCPVQGDASTSGGMIEGGKYEASGLTPGRYSALIVAGVDYKPEQSEQLSDEERMKQRQGGGPPIAKITPETEGNQQEVEVKTGSQELNFILKSSASK